jgi:hypothetical protein
MDKNLDMNADQPAEHDLLESFAESLSSMDYTALCVMNHKSREDAEIFQAKMHMHGEPSFAPPPAPASQMSDQSLPALNVFNTNSLANIEKMHWQYLDGNLKNLYENGRHQLVQDNLLKINDHSSHNNHSNPDNPHSHSHSINNHNNHNNHSHSMNSKMSKVVKSSGIRAPSAAAKERRR